MIIERYSLPVGSIVADVTIKDIRNLHIGVYPPVGNVRVAAPAAMDRAAVHGALVVRLPWIKQQMVAFARQPREGRREYRAGESHWFMGRRYRLRIQGCRSVSGVSIQGTYLHVAVRGEPDTNKVAQCLDRWRRCELAARTGPLVANWADKLGVARPAVGIKRMHTRWGSCSTANRRIWLNLALSRTPVKCLEYVVVHELAHFLVRAHDQQFTELLDRHLPDWRGARAMLAELPYADTSALGSDQSTIKFLDLRLARQSSTAFEDLNDELP